MKSFLRPFSSSFMENGNEIMSVAHSPLLSCIDHEIMSMAILPFFCGIDHEIFSTVILLFH